MAESTMDCSNLLDRYWGGGIGDGEQTWNVVFVPGAPGKNTGLTPERRWLASESEDHTPRKQACRVPKTNISAAPCCTRESEQAAKRNCFTSTGRGRT